MEAVTKADRSPEIDDEKGEMIECEPTVAYDLLGRTLHQPL